MSRKSIRVPNPAFSEYLYSILYNASVETRQAIPPQYMKLIRQEKVAKKFARTASLDEAAILLSYLGVEHFLVFVAKDTSFKDLKAVLEKYERNQKVASLKDIIALKLFVTSDKELLTLLGYMSMTIQQRAYTMNLELTRVGYHLQHWGKHLLSNDGEVSENSNEVAKTLLSGFLTLQRAAYLFRLSALEMQLLLYLYPLKSVYVSITQIASYFAGYISRTKLRGRLKSLVNSRHIRQKGTDEYSITGIGIRTINDFFSAVIQANSFG